MSEQLASKDGPVTVPMFPSETRTQSVDNTSTDAVPFAGGAETRYHHSVDPAFAAAAQTDEPEVETKVVEPPKKSPRKKPATAETE